MIRRRAQVITVTRQRRAGAVWVKACTGDGVGMEIGRLADGNVIIQRAGPPKIALRLSRRELRCLLKVIRTVVYE